MSAEKSMQNSELDIVDVVRNKVKESREELSAEMIDTLFYVAMKSYPEIFVITEEYSISDRTFDCDIYEGGSDIETILKNIYQKVRERHQETYKIKSLFEDDLKETMHQPIQYIKGYVVQNGAKISSFSLFEPRDTTRFDWVKAGVFAKREVEVKNVKHDDEVEIENFYYQFASPENDLSERKLDKAKSLIVKATQRKFNLSDEMFAYQKSEKIWNDFLNAGSVDIDKFEDYIKGVYQFKESCSPEIKPLVEDLYQEIFKKRSLLNQYDLMVKQDIKGKIYID